MLYNPSTGRVWGTRLAGSDLVVISGVPGKEKQRRTSHPDGATALATAEQEERKRLRKDFALVAPHAPAGAPVMVRALDRSYTGALPVLAVDDAVLCTSDAPQGTEILLFDADGESRQLARIEPHHQVSKLAGRADLGFLALVDHAVCRLSPNQGTVEQLVAMGDTPASVLTQSGVRAGWYDQPDLVVVDLTTGKEFLRRPVEPALYAGHSVQLQAELSPDGEVLAVCSTPGTIEMVEVATGQVAHSITGDFEMVSELHFTADGRWLLVKQEYGNWSLLCFDAVTGQARTGWPDLGDLGDAQIAVATDAHRVAIADQRGRLRILDLDSLQMQQEFQVDQVSSSFGLTWIGSDRIAIRTDLGFIGLYAVSAAE